MTIQKLIYGAIDIRDMTQRIKNVDWEALNENVEYQSTAFLRAYFTQRITKTEYEVLDKALTLVLDFNKKIARIDSQ